MALLSFVDSPPSLHRLKVGNANLRISTMGGTSPVAVLQSFENIGTVDLQRRLLFDRVFWSGVIAKFAGFVTCITAAFLLRDYWALIYGLIATRVTTVVVSYIVSAYRPRFGLYGLARAARFLEMDGDHKPAKYG